MLTLARSLVITAVVAAAVLGGVVFFKPSLVGEPGTAAPVKAGQSAVANQSTVAGVTANMALAAEEQTSSVIVTVGQGTVKAKPDIATVYVGVTAVAAKAQEAQSQVNDKIAAIVAKLKGMGITEDDIRTTNIYLSPEMDRPEPVMKGQPEFNRYRAGQDLAVTVDDISKAAPVLDAAIEAGANSGMNIGFGLKNDSALRIQALEEAVKAARPKADAMARGLGVNITGAVSVVDLDGGGVIYPPEAVKRGLGAGDAASAVYPGDLSIVARVQVTYSFGNK